MEGKRIGKYRVTGRLGAGGMGVVLRAFDEQLKRSVALKLLPSGLAQQGEARARFLREAQAISALDHPNICTLYDIGEHEEQLFVAMACYEGTTLRALLERGPPPRHETPAILVQIARALERAHEAGIVHRDVKPENVMITNRAEVKLLDFGLAKWRGAADLTVAGAMTGTPGYMSPEQVEGLEVDHRTDIWALGVISYEMLAGTRPFTGNSTGSLLRSILHDEPRPLSEVAPDVPAAVEDAVRKALVKDSLKRSNSASELRKAFEQLAVLSQEVVTAPPHSLAVQPTANTPEGCGGLKSGGKSVAVLPFADRSPQRDQAYFCEGLADELITGLARLNRFRVASRTASFRLGETSDAIEAGKRLHVDAVLEGSVRRAEKRLRVAVQLIEVASGFCVWSDSYDRQLEDVFEIQEEIAEHVVRGLVGAFGPEDRAALIAGTTEQLEAYEYYLRGRSLFWQGRKQNLEAALRMYKRAIELDPKYALAHAGIARCGTWLFADFGGDSARLQEADEASRKAVQLAPTLAEAHVARGGVLEFKGEHQAAHRAFQEALRLNPRSFEAHFIYSWFLIRIGDLERAAERLKAAQDVQADEYQASGLLAMVCRSLGRTDEQLEARRVCLERAGQRLKLNEREARAWYMGAMSLLELGDRPRSFEWAQRALAIDPDDATVSYNLACFYAIAGDAEQALDMLERSINAGMRNLAWLEHDSDFDLVRAHPRFVALLETLK